MITIVIATKNRSDFICRLFEYLAGRGYAHWISIGDSSDGAHVQRMREAVKAFEGKLKIKYVEYPNHNVIQCHNALLATIETPYMVCISDSALVVPDSLEKCIRFLEQNPDYCAAHGKASLFTLKSEDPYGAFDYVSRLGLPCLEQESARARLLYQMKHYFVTVYCVYRIEIWKSVWFDYSLIKDPLLGGELLPCAMTAVLGKVKELDCLYLMRHMHQRRYFMPDVYDWVTNPQWSASYQFFEKTLVEALMAKDGIDRKAAQQTVKEAFWAYLSQGLTAGYRRRFEPPAWEGRIKERLKVLPFLGDAARQVRNYLVREDGLSLAALMRTGSKYHRDFMPIYGLVAGACRQQEGSKEKVGA